VRDGSDHKRSPLPRQAFAYLFGIFAGVVLRQVFPGLFPAPPTVDGGTVADGQEQLLASSSQTGEAIESDRLALPAGPNNDPAASSLPQHNPDLRKIARFALAVLATLGAAVTATELGSPLRPAQYWLGFSGIVLVLLEIADGGEGGSHGAAPPTQLAQRGLIVRCLVFAAIALTAFLVEPNLYLVWVDCIFFWLSALSMWKCTAWTIPTTGSFWGRVSRAIIILKRMFGGRRGARGAFAFGLIVVTAVVITTAASVATVAEIKATKAQPAKAVPSVTHSTPTHLPTASTPESVAPTASAAPSSSSLPEWNGSCGSYAYPTVPAWAVQELGHLLGGSAGLGPSEEGCVQRLTYDVSTGFVWGEGVNPTSGAALSIVFDSRVLPPAIVLTPALQAVRQLIHNYKVLGSPGKLFPRYSTAGGDYYLLDTESEGTCVVIRSRSGSAAEAPPYTTLYPSTAVAWTRVMELTHSWQWPVEAATPNKNGEIVYELFAPGSAVSDATITYDSTSREATWHGYTYPRSQRELSPTMLRNMSLTP
jgi:hypothetical protein